jgi:hypothetical protein
MITSVERGTINERSSVLDFLETKKFTNVIDVGASYNPWAGDHVTHVVDFKKIDGYINFTGNICEELVWDEISNTNINFDFSICTHTLEDILNPHFVSKKLQKHSDGGFIAVPSKWVELSHNGPLWKGWLHHRWLFDVIDDTLVLVPKLPYLEYIDTSVFKDKPSELRFFWEESLPVKILNDDFIGPGEAEYLELVYDFLEN